MAVTNMQFLHAAATQVQAAWRGHQGRKAATLQREVKTEVYRRLRVEGLEAEAFNDLQGDSHSELVQAVTTHQTRMELQKTMTKGLEQTQISQHWDRFRVMDVEVDARRELQAWHQDDGVALAQHLRQVAIDARADMIADDEPRARGVLERAELHLRMGWALQAKRMQAHVSLTLQLKAFESSLVAIEALARGDLADEEEAGYTSMLDGHDLRVFEQYETSTRQVITWWQVQDRNDIAWPYERDGSRLRQGPVAATKIQKLYRGHRGRLTFSDRKQAHAESSALQLLQRLGRGFAARKALGPVWHCQKREIALRRQLDLQERAGRMHIVHRRQNMKHDAAVCISLAWRCYLARVARAGRRELQKERALVVRAESIDRALTVQSWCSHWEQILQQRIRNKADLRETRERIARLRHLREAVLAEREELQFRRHAAHLRSSAIRGWVQRRRVRRAQQAQREQLERQSLVEEMEVQQECVQKIWSLWRLYLYRRDVRWYVEMDREERMQLGVRQEQVRQEVRRQADGALAVLQTWWVITTGRKQLLDVTEA